ncbi:hypothetical protein JB92DRAFT_3143640, partial [Gautieria morchelliformis]
DQHADQGSNAVGRRPAHQRLDHLPPRPAPTTRSRDPIAPNAHRPQDTPPVSQEIAAKLKKQEEEILWLRVEIAATRPQQQQQQPQQQPQQQQQQRLPHQLQPPPPQQPEANQQRAQADGQDALFADDAAIERARALAATKDENKKAQLPDLIPGFKASALDIEACVRPPKPA